MFFQNFDGQLEAIVKFEREVINKTTLDMLRQYGEIRALSKSSDGLSVCLLLLDIGGSIVHS